MKRLMGVVAAAGLVAAASADFSSNFEAPTYTGSAAGTVATGQDGWTLPSGVDSHIFTYAGNALGLVANPTGGDQFIGGRSQGGTSFARAQHAHDFTTDNRWVISYDFAANWNGVTPSAVNLSSFSLQDSVAARSFIALNNWLDNNNPAAGWKAEYNVFDSTGAALNNQSPGVGWASLVMNHWYRQTTIVNFDNNMIEEVRLLDLTSGVLHVAQPRGWFMLGGANPTQPMPVAVRFFEGGNAGNIMGWDNLSIIPGPGAMALAGVGLVISRRRR